MRLAFTCHLEVEFHISIVGPLKKIRTLPQFNSGKMLALRFYEMFVVHIFAIWLSLPVVAHVEDECVKNYVLKKIGIVMFVFSVLPLSLSLSLNFRPMLRLKDLEFSA